MSEPETKVPFTTFLRHFLITHLKSDSAVVLDELERRSRESGEPLATLLAEYVRVHFPKQGHFVEDSWYDRKVPLDACFCAHPESHGDPVSKNERFVDFMPAQREQIDSGSLRCSAQIRAPWSEMPPPLVREREPGKYYVLDGQLRVIRHWYHKVSKVRVFIYRGDLKV